MRRFGVAMAGGAASARPPDRLQRLAPAGDRRPIRPPARAGHRPSAARPGLPEPARYAAVADGRWRRTEPQPCAAPVFAPPHARRRLCGDWRQRMTAAAAGRARRHWLRSAAAGAMVRPTKPSDATGLSP
jgi:hypothetical protein